MQQLYSSGDGSEVRSGLAKVISLAGFRKAKSAAETAAADPSSASGDRGGDRAKTGPVTLIKGAKVVMKWGKW
jgi:hypothetical protein